MQDKDEIKALPQTDVGIKHHFSDSVYAKEMHLPAGHIAITHKHTYSHLSVLAEGKVIVETTKGTVFYTAPNCIEILKGVEHQITAIEDVTWYCIHATDLTDPDEIDKATTYTN